MRFHATLLALVVAASGLEAQAVNVRNGLALDGYDPVAYHTEHRATKGSPAFTATHDGAVYRFASEASRAAFEADPARYLPAYGGYCAYGMARGYRAKIDPQAFTVVNGRLYLNYSLEVRDRWSKDIAGYLQKADANWVRLRDSTSRQ